MKTKMTTYEITIGTATEHASAMRGAGMTAAGTYLRFDGEKFREGAFDVETWDDENEALAAFARFADDDDFAPGLEMVLTREIYDEETDEFETEEILVKPLS